MLRIYVGAVVILFLLPIAPLRSGKADEVRGIWTSAAELRSQPMQGPAWEAVLRGANRDVSRPNLADKDDNTNVYVLAAAIVYARTGQSLYRQKVKFALDTLVAGGKPQGTTLAWARELGAYVLAADLIGYRTPEFQTWLDRICHEWEGDEGRTLAEMFHKRPNNWGMHAFGSLCAAYRYLGDDRRLREIRETWIQGVVGPNPGFRYGDDLSWHADPQNPRLINPQGAVKEGMAIDGIIPDDMRRGDSFRNPPKRTNYPWESQQGMILAARILERAGLPIWDVGDRAMYRAAYALQVQLGGWWRAKGDDRWMLAFYDHAYRTNWSLGEDVWGHGKNAGWAYVLTPRKPSGRLKR
jgi:hypothetical protein